MEFVNERVWVVGLIMMAAHLNGWRLKKRKDSVQSTYLKFTDGKHTVSIRVSDHFSKGWYPRGLAYSVWVHRAYSGLMSVLERLAGPVNQSEVAQTVNEDAIY
jgi:hypothetical protein